MIPQEVRERAQAGDFRPLSQLLTRAENNRLEDTGELGSVFAGSSRSDAHVIGITGPPGSGKSTLTSALVSVFRERGQRVAVLAVDPSSPFSGGAILGDRIRMLKHTDDDGVFIRSMASRGHLGGLAAASLTSIAILMNAAFDIVLVETVGVGQSEIEIMAASDTTLVLTAPGSGDGIQAVKAGILEIADVLVVNKADQPRADVTLRELRNAVNFASRERLDWKPPVVSAVASAPEGAGDVVAAIDDHRMWLRNGRLTLKRRNQTAHLVRRLAIEEIERRLLVPDSLINGLEAGEIDLPTAVRSALNSSFSSIS